MVTTAICRNRKARLNSNPLQLVTVGRQPAFGRKAALHQPLLFKTPMGEFLDAGFRLYRRHVRMFIGLTLLLGIVPLLLSYPDWIITNVAALVLFCFFYPAALFVCASATAEGKTASLRSTLREAVCRAPR